MIRIMVEEVLGRLAGLRSEVRTYEPSALVFRRDSPVEWLHLIEQGSVNLLRYKADGSVVVLQRADEGYFLAEASLFSSVYHCDAVAMAASRVRRFPKPQVIEALRSDCGFASAWAEYLSREVQRVRARAEILSLRRLDDRLEAWLATRGGELPPKGSWAGLARDLGVSPEALYRHLAQRKARSPTPA